MPRRRVVLVAFPDVQILDVAGPSEVFSLADRDAGESAYSLELVAPDPGEITASSGLRHAANGAVDACRGPIDTLVVAGGRGVQAAARDPRLTNWLRLADHLDDDLSVPALAECAYMSPRNFARVFSREVGVTPAAYVESLRLERARTLLETSELQLEEIALRCGFGTVETLRRVFGRRLGVGPSAYRSRFAPANVTPISRRNSVA